MSSEETTEQIRRDGLDTVSLSLGETEVIPEHITIEIRMADGRTVKIEGDRDQPRTGPDSGPVITGLDLPLSGSVESEIVAEKLLIATAWRLCGFELYDLSELEAAKGEADDE